MNRYGAVVCLSILMLVLSQGVLGIAEFRQADAVSAPPIWRRAVQEIMRSRPNRPVVVVNEMCGRSSIDGIPIVPESLL